MDEPSLASPLYVKDADIGNIHGDVSNSICTAINEILPEETFGEQKSRGFCAFIYIPNWRDYPCSGKDFSH